MTLPGVFQVTAVAPNIVVDVQKSRLCGKTVYLCFGISGDVQISTTLVSVPNDVAPSRELLFSASGLALSLKPNGNLSVLQQPPSQNRYLITYVFNI